MVARPSDELLQAVTGLEGGVVGSGATCGIITGGVLGLAQLYAPMVNDRGDPARAAILDIAGQYVQWYVGRHGTQRCRERTGVDFHTPGGQMRYFLYGGFFPCLAAIGRSIRRLHDRSNRSFEPWGTADEEPAFHCAEVVMAKIRQATGAGSPEIENIAYVLDGGVGLSGGVCGALAGAVMSVNLVFGINTRRIGLSKNIGKFVTGHVNLFSGRQRRMPEPFGLGKQVVEEFKSAAGSLECRSITGKHFSQYDEFTAHTAGPSACKTVIDASVQSAVRVLEKWR